MPATDEQIKDILQSKSAWLEQDICVAGWIKQLRWQSETLGFCEVNDGSVVVNIQCVVNGSKVDADVFAAFKERAAVGASVIIRGTLVRSPGSEQFSEIQVRRGVLFEPLPGLLFRVDLDSPSNPVLCTPPLPLPLSAL